MVCYGKKVYGEVGIVRSGPLGSEYEEVFEKGELVRAVRFYGVNDRDKIFDERELSRVRRSFGGV